MEQAQQMGMNRTGIDMSPIHSKQMIRGAKELTPAADRGDGQTMETIDRQYIKEAETIGSVPIPGTIKGALKSAMEKITGSNPEILINKLGERLAFERSGVRLYQSVITKCEAKAGANDIAPINLDQLRQIQAEEAQHFQMLTDVMLSLGADPTAQTPDADVSGMASMGIQQVLSDPRTTLLQSLEMLLTVELTDNASWELLMKLADDMGLDPITTQFREALEQEEVHLQRIKGWYKQLVFTEAGQYPEPKGEEKE